MPDDKFTMVIRKADDKWWWYVLPANVDVDRSVRYGTLKSQSAKCGSCWREKTAQRRARLALRDLLANAERAVGSEGYILTDEDGDEVDEEFENLRKRLRRT